MKQFGKNDWVAVGVFVLLAAIVFFFPWGTDLLNGVCWKGFSLSGIDNFGEVVKEYPYLTGFLKVAILASFGEMIKTRGRTGSYYTEKLWAKFLVWGLYGMLFTIAFPIFATGIEVLSHTPIWFTCGSGFWKTLVFAFSTSLWLNLIFCYPMMLSHEWFNRCINEKRFIGGTEFISNLDPAVWGSFLPKTILVFWIPAHTVTFCLPPDYRILMSAFLSLALGFILTVKK